MTVQTATAVGPAKLTIAYERFGDPSAPPVLLIMGIATQMLGWPDDFCAALVSEGMHVIRFDNRDIGLSTHLANAPLPNLPAALAGDTSSASYTLSDMAADSVGLLDALGLASAHIVGASMGGFIAQTIAIEHPTRVRSLTSMMSSTGDRSVGQMHPDALALFAAPPVQSREDAMERALHAYRIVGSRAYPPDEAAVRARAGLAYDRAYDPIGIGRQAVAVIASGDRTQKLHAIRVPTLVLHGAEDRMCDASGGRATAAAIPDAKLVILDGWGHDLPRPLWPQLVQHIASIVRAGEARLA